MRDSLWIALVSPIVVWLVGGAVLYAVGVPLAVFAHLGIASSLPIGAKPKTLAAIRPASPGRSRERLETL
ncbi:hypothetical protein [Halopiger djelfimassiliensis]|uniref:hypothetical protein n=1 Tax=Halopiger djelfimassiliensis TaxID=1293047 RepID=UPI000677ED73|nr:hypothetical protein [Halopiger djelfimassiliensis]